VLKKQKIEAVDQQSYEDELTFVRRDSHEDDDDSVEHSQIFDIRLKEDHFS